MGYDRRAALGVTRLDFTGDLNGLTVYVRPARLSAFKVGQAAVGVLGGAFDLRRDLGKLRPLFDEFAAHLAAWTLEDAGVPVPAVPAAWFEQDAAFLVAVSFRWLTEIMGLGGAAGDREPRQPAPDAGDGAAEAEMFDPSDIPIEVLSAVPDPEPGSPAPVRPVRRRAPRKPVTVPADTAQAI